MASNNLFKNIATSVLLACAAMVAVSMVHREFFTPAQDGILTGQHIANWKDLAANRTPTTGNADSPVTILDFSDYECPFCKSLEGKLRTLAAQQPDVIRIIRYEFPLTLIHPYAYEAALAGKCAAKQDVVGSFQTLIYQNSTKLGTLNWRNLAANANIPNLDKFTSCLEQKKLAGEVDADIAVGQRLGFKSTPTLVINGDVVSGDQSKETLSKLVKRYAKG
jgi:protein-disulfide isomerase